MDDLERIRRRHPNIPQDPLFEMPEDTSSGNIDGEKTRKIKSTRTAFCPHCCGPNQSNEKIGVIRVSTTREVFRDHDKFTVNGRRIPCLGSGTDAPPRKRMEDS